MVYQGCCSNANNFLDLGIGTSLTVVVGSAAATTSQSTSSSIPLSSTSASTSSTAPTPLNTPSQSSTVSATATPPAAPPSKPNDPGVKIGAGIGVPLGVALLAALIYILFLNRSRSRSVHLLRYLRSRQENKNSVQEQELFPMSSLSHGYGHNETTQEQDSAFTELPQLDGQARSIPQLPA